MFSVIWIILTILHGMQRLMDVGNYFAPLLPRLISLGMEAATR
jgi:hypothetical protein